MVLSPELEYLAYTNESFVRKINPLTKLILLICVLVTNLIAKLNLEFLLLAGVLLVFAFSKISVKTVKRPVIAAILLSIVIFFVKLHFLKIGSAVNILLDFYPEAHSVAVLYSLKILSGVFTILIFVGTTPLYEVLSALRVIKVPKTAIDIFLIIYKYIFIINEEGLRTRNAQIVRLGYSSFRRSLESFGTLAGILILRSINKGESMIDALNVRGYKGDMFFPTKVKSLIFLDYLLIFGVGLFPLMLSLLWMR